MNTINTNINIILNREENHLDLIDSYIEIEFVVSEDAGGVFANDANIRLVNYGMMALLSSINLETSGGRTIIYYIGFVISGKAKFYMYKAIYDYFEKELDCSYHYRDTDSIFININVPLDSNIEIEMNKIKDISHNNELGKMKDELPNDTILEACFLKAKAYCYNTVKGEDDKKLKGITKATIRN